MRNLKRALSLTLASVMLLGMMVMGSSAASYSDVDDSDNIEAIEVLQAVQVMRDDDKGNFNPDSPVTRAEMAVVMALLLDLDYQYYEATCPFTDVPAWARPYVGACYANGIVSGYNATTYGANDGVTPVQAASMMMRALGYFQYAEDYKDGFETATVRQGTRIGIFNDVGSSATAAMTRNQVAQMALNALECTMVDARKSTADITVGSGDTAVTINGNVEYIVRTSRENFAKAINRVEGGNSSTTGLDGNTVELGEQLYSGDLKKTSDYDAFGAPAVRWVYKNAEIGVYANEADTVYTAEVKSKDIYADLGLSGTVTADLYVDGDEVEGGFSVARNGSAGDAKLGGNGVLVKAYETGEDSVIINVINSYVGEITKVTEAKGSDARNVKVDSFSKTFETEAFDEEDIVVYTVAKDELTAYLKDNIVEYSKTSKDVYTLEKKGTALTALSTDQTITIDSGKAKVTLAATTVYADGKTVFLTDDGDDENNGRTNAKAVVDDAALAVESVVMVDGNYKTPIADALKAKGLRVTGWTEASSGTPAAGDTVTAVDGNGTVFTYEFGTAAAEEYWTITVTTTANNNASTGSTIGVTVTGAEVPATQTITTQQATDGATVAFKVTVGTTDISAVGGTIADLST